MPVLAELGALLREALLDAWALVQPVECLGCGRPDRAVCPACRAAIRPLPARRVRCDAAVAVPVWTGADYAGPIRNALLGLKEHGRHDAARLLAPLLEAALRAALANSGATGRLELARIPTSRRAALRRGLDPLGELLGALRLRDARALRPGRGRRAAPQKTLDRQGRLAVGPGRFRARGSLTGRSFLLVDDVVTTGATLAAAIAAIEQAGGRVRCCAVVAAPDLARRTLAVHPARSWDPVPAEHAMRIRRDGASRS